MRSEETDSNREPDTNVSSGDPVVDEETDLAGEEAAAIGGDPGGDYADEDPAAIPVEEGGGGEAEGFEQAEELLIEQAEHGDTGGNPLAHAGRNEEPASAGAVYGEADETVSSDQVEEERAAADPEERDED